MMLFREDGHLTDEALQAAVQEVLDEMARLEVAEHLSFCDGCLERYTALLTDDTLRTPAQPILPPVLSRIRKRAVGILFNRYTTYAAAACLALTLWGAGVFTGLADADYFRESGTQPAAAAAATPGVSVTMQTRDFLSGITQSMNDVMSRMMTDLLERQKTKPQQDDAASAKP